MDKRFRAGLVVGKFLPLHQGHVFLIKTALEQCQQVYLISYSLPELPGCGAELREHWLADAFPQAHRLVVTPARVAAWQAEGRALADLPDNAAPDAAHRHFVGQLCLAVLQTTVDAVFTSEDYGDGFAAVLSQDFAAVGAGPVQHVQVDKARLTVPISATRLRADIHGLRGYLAPGVYADFARRICLLGGESTGKSTLAVALAAALDTASVAEYGRELWERRQGELAYCDLLDIGREQVRREGLAAESARRYLICDTSPLTTLFYCQHLFGRAEPELQALAERPYDLTLLCAPDFPFVQDGTRQGVAFQAMQHAWYQAELAARGIAYSLVQGSVAERVARTTRLLSDRFGK